MKSIAYLSILAVAFACVLACDPDSDNKPMCSTENLNVSIRNFWDPIHYWKCSSANAEAELIQCPPENAFASQELGCVHFSEWRWIPPCHEQIAN